MTEWRARIGVILTVIIFGVLIVGIIVGDPGVIVVSLLLFLVLIAATPRRAEGMGTRRPLHPVMWFVLGGLFASLLLNQSDRRSDPAPFYDTQQTFSGQILIPETFTVTDDLAASVSPGDSCIPILESVGRWQQYGNTDRPTVVARDGENRILTYVSVSDPMVMGVVAGTEVRCGYTAQLQSTVRGLFIQLEVNGRAPDVIGGPLTPTNGQYRELRPLTPGDGRPLVTPVPESQATP